MGVRIVPVQPVVRDDQGRIDLQSGHVLDAGSRRSAEKKRFDSKSVRVSELLRQGQRLPGKGVHPSLGVVQQYVDLTRHRYPRAV